jgi:hypothetical protein
MELHKRPVASPRPVPPALLHAAAGLFGLVGALALLTTRPQLSATLDESNHLAAGLEWWQHGTYTWFTENPPLGRVAVAAVPYLTGLRLPSRAGWDPHDHAIFETWWVGLDLLHGGAGYETNLSRARMGVFPFYLVALLAVWAMAGGRRRPLAAALAVGLTATLPSLVAHGALATTDVPFLAMFLLLLLALRRWLERASRARAAWLGAALAGAMLAKFTTLAFFPVTLLALLVARRLNGVSARPSVPDGAPLPPRALLEQAALALAVATVTVWAGYRFSWGAVGDLPATAIGWFPILPPVGERGALARRLLAMKVPMPALFHGLLFLKGHNAAGHTAFLMGATSRTGFRGFYPLALLVKTPLPFLAITIAGLVAMVRRRHPPEGWWWTGLALAAAGILLLSTFNRVNLGLRHVMPILPMLAVASAGALAAPWLHHLPSLPRRALLGALAATLLFQSASVWRARPNLLGWFNLLAGPDPAGLLLDSDNDWGQDLLQLRRELSARRVPALHLAYFGFARPCALGFPPLEALVPGRPARGWIAISENFYRERNTITLGPDPCDPRASYRPGEIPPHPFAWLKPYDPVAIVGSSIRLYFIP